MRTKGAPPVAFIHIPKTGGTYVGYVCPGLYDLEHTVIDDASLGDRLNWSRRHQPVDIAGYRVLATVRNPYPLLVSYYLMRCKEVEEKHAGTQRTVASLRRDLVRGGYRPDQVTSIQKRIAAGVASGLYDGKFHKDGHDIRTFSKFLPYVTNREDRHDARYAKSFMFFQLFRTSGVLAVDYIARQETLDADLDVLSREWSFEYAPEDDRANAGVYTQLWESQYTSDAKRSVAEHYGRELRMFGYSFDGESKPMLGRIVTDEDREAWRYDFETDVLTYKGEVL